MAVSRNTYSDVKQELVSRLSLRRAIRTLNVLDSSAFQTKACAPSKRSLIALGWESNKPEALLLVRLPHVRPGLRQSDVRQHPKRKLPRHLR